VRAPGSGSALGSLLVGLASVATLPLAIYATRWSGSYELLHAGWAIPVAVALGLVAIALSRRSRIQAAVSLASTRRRGLAGAGRFLGLLGLCMAAAALVSLGVYGLLEYVGSRD
jgi:hypothetical protein